MTSILDDYLREVEATLRVEPERKRQIVDELRSHLAEKVEELRRGQPERGLAEIEREVVNDFGSPRELALAYHPEGPVLQNSAGDVVLRLGQAVGRGTVAVGRAVGRGTGLFLKWLAIAVAALLVIAIGLGIWAFYELRPVAEAIADQSQPIYSYYEGCEGTPCNGAFGNESFYVVPEARAVHFDIRVGHPWEDGPNATGSVHVTVRDPSGEIKYDRLVMMNNETSFHQELRWAGTAGNWTVAYEFTEFLGVIDVETYAWSTLWRND